MSTELREQIARAMFDRELAYDRERSWEEWADIFLESADICLAVVSFELAKVALEYEDEHGNSGELGAGIARAIRQRCATPGSPGDVRPRKGARAAAAA